MQEILHNLDAFWIWLALACLLLAVEVLIVPSGFFLCLGSSAVVVAAVVFFLPDLTWLWAVTLFSVLSVASGWLWWKLLRKRRSVTRAEQAEALNVKSKQLVGYRGVLAEDMRGGRGRLRVNDSPWPAEADQDYPAGTLVEVVEVTGITLKVKAIP